MPRPGAGALSHRTPPPRYGTCRTAPARAGYIITHRATLWLSLASLSLSFYLLFQLKVSLSSPSTSTPCKHYPDTTPTLSRIKPAVSRGATPNTRCQQQVRLTPRWPPRNSRSILRRARCGLLLASHPLARPRALHRNISSPRLALRRRPPIGCVEFFSFSRASARNLIPYFHHITCDIPYIIYV